MENIDKTEYFETFFRDYYTNLKLEFPDKIVSKDLEEIGQKELYQDWLKVISGKKITINYGKGRGKYGELYELAVKNASNLLENAKAKISKKGCDYLIANDISRKDIGFNTDDNEVTILSKNGETKLINKAPKRVIARKIFEWINTKSQNE